MRTPCRLIILLTLILFICIEAVWAADITERLEYPEFWLQEGVAQYSLHNYDRALTLIDNALGQDPTLAGGWMWRGRVLDQLGRSSEADESYAKAKELDPLIEDPYKKKVGALADLEVTPVPTARPAKTEDKLKDMIKSDVDLGKKPDPLGPDLTMYDLQAAISSETKQVEITAIIGNEGIKPSQDFFITFYGSYNTPVTSNDTAIGFYLIPNLLPGTKKTIQGFFPVSQIPSGNYYIGAYIDPNNEVMEISEDNNGKTAPTQVDVPEVSSSEGSQLGSSQLAVPITPVTEPISNKRADLVIDAISGQAEAYLGDTIPVSTTVRNAGDADAGQFRLTVYLSRDTVVSDDDIPLGSGDVPDLAAGKAREGSASVTIPLNVIPGKYYLIALADSQKKISEKNRENNSKVQSEQITIKTLDLNETPVSGEIVPEESLPVSEVTPVSTQESEPGITTQVLTTPEPSPVPTQESEPGITNQVLTTPEPSPVPTQESEPGITNQVLTTPEPSPVPTQESSEILPDLVPIDVSSALTGKPGGNIEVSTTVLNMGKGDAGNFSVSLFLSPDTVIREDEDLLVGMGEVENLSAGKQRGGNATAPIPATIKPGTYYFGLFVDSGRVINETDEINNYGSSLIPITIG